MKRIHHCGWGGVLECYQPSSARAQGSYVIVARTWAFAKTSPLLSSEFRTHLEIGNRAVGGVLNDAASDDGEETTKPADEEEGSPDGFPS